MIDNEKSVISQKLDDFKEFFGQRLDRIEKQLDGKCDTCINAPTFRERFRSQWFHICALWCAVVGLGGGIVYLGILFYNHIAGK